MKSVRLLLSLLLLIQLTGCGNGSSNSAESNTSSCPETGDYACQSGATEPLYTYQWALNAVTSYFADFPLVSDGVTDINVEQVHTQGIKGQGVNVIVLDDGIEINHPDLKANINTSMTWNFETNTSNPTPTSGSNAHGTNTTGMIGAAQNGIGVMGIAPRVTLGGARYVGVPNANMVEAYGGGLWSKNADVFNASYGSNSVTPTSYSETDAGIASLQSFPNLRNGKGAVMVKSAGNEYQYQTVTFSGVAYGDFCSRFYGAGVPYPYVISCGNSAYDIERLQLPVIVTAAANAMGYKASYSTAGPVNWITGLGGESTALGNYGEAGSATDELGPQIYSTDLTGCERGYSKNGLSALDDAEFLIGGSPINLQKNSSCDYDQMNGTSAAAPTVTGVVALMLSANPNLGWRDIRDILRRTARQIDLNYGNEHYRNRTVQLNIVNRPTMTGDTSTALVDGSHFARLDYGWQTNAAGNKYSTWYGWGLVDAKAAVEMARSYTSYKPTQLVVPGFTRAIENKLITYGQVTEVGTFNVTDSNIVDMVQLGFIAGTDSPDVCMGSVGIFLKSPGGTVSILNTPYNVFQKASSGPWDTRNGGLIDDSSDFVLGSYAFYGESSQGTWTVYAVSGMPTSLDSCNGSQTPSLSVGYRIFKAM